MIKIEVHAFAQSFLKPIVLELEDWVEKAEEPERREIVTLIICNYLNKNMYKGRTDWIPHKMLFGIKYVSWFEPNFVSIITAKRLSTGSL